MMRMMRADRGEKGFTTVSEKCPCCPAGSCAAHSNPYQPEAAERFTQTWFARRRLRRKPRRCCASLFSAAILSAALLLLSPETL